MLWKNTICKQLLKYFVESKHIVVSDVVKHITGIYKSGEFINRFYSDKEIEIYSRTINQMVLQLLMVIINLKYMKILFRTTFD